MEAKKTGKTRFIGVTGHQDPAIIRKCIDLFPFDTVLMPVNPAEPAARSFLTEVLPLAAGKQMGIIGMKVYLRGLPEQLPFYTSMQPFFDFALSQPVSCVVIGCDDLVQLEQNMLLCPVLPSSCPLTARWRSWPRLLPMPGNS